MTEAKTADVIVVGGGISGTATAWQLAQMGVKTLLLEGEYFTINDELKVATADVVTDASGFANVNFQPPLRKAVTAGTTLEIQNPYILFCAEGPDAATWALTRPTRHGIKLTCVEDI